MFDFFSSKKKPSVEDNLADIVIGLLKRTPDQWKFKGSKADCELMHIKVDFPSWQSLTFQMRDRDHKAFYPDITPSRAKRKELYHALTDARDTKLLSIMSAEVHERILLLTDERQRGEVNG